MKKAILSLLTVSLITFSSEVNSASTKNSSDIQLGINVTEMSTTEILGFLTKELGLTAKQQPAVKTAVDGAGSEISKINKDVTKTATQKTTAKSSLVEGLIKQLSGGILNSVQSAKLTGLTNQLKTMFSQLK